jgi:hypothetical protein
MAEESKLNIIVNLIADKFKKGAAQVTNGLQGINKMLKAFSVVAIGRQIFRLGKDFADAAGQLETVNRSFARSFGGFADDAAVGLNKLSESLNRNLSVLKQGAISFNSFFKGLGFAGAEASKMSVSMQKLSLDLASFYGIEDANAQKRFLAALAGSPETLDQFGINLKQAALQQELFSMGLKSTVQNTDETIKTQARLNIIMRSMTESGVLGDASRSMDTYAGKVRQLEANYLTLKQTAGSKLIPKINDLTTSLTEAASAISSILNSDVSNLFGILDAAMARQYEAELIKIVNTQSELNKLAEYNSKFRNASWGLTKDEYDAYVDLSKILREVNGEIEKNYGNLETTEILKKKQLYFDEKINILQNKINEATKKRQGYLDSIIAASDAELAVIDEKYDKEKELNQLKGKSSVTSNLELEKKKLLEQIPIYEAAYSLQIKSKEELQFQYDKLEAINGAIRTELELQREALKLQIKNSQIDITRKVKIEREFSDKFDLSLSDQARSIGYAEPTTEETDNNLRILLGLPKNPAERAQQILDEASKKISTVEMPKINYGSAAKEVEAGAMEIIDILRPITDAMSSLWMEVLTPPDSTISKEEQKEKTMAAFGGIMVGLGQALFSLGMGSLLASLGLDSLGKNPALAVAMMGAGSGLIALGKGQLQKAKNSQFSREGGGSANSGGAGGQSMTDFMSAVQGEQVFRLAGNDLVTAINRSNTFQGTIGG